MTNPDESSDPKPDSDEAILRNYVEGGGTSPASGEHPPIPGLEFLGMGYDIFDRYASVDSCKQPILDFSAEREVEQPVIDRSLSLEIAEKAFNSIPMELRLIYKRPDKVTYLPRFEVNSVNEFESTIEDQINTWTAHANISGNYGLFAGEIDARFSSKLAKLATTKYYSLVSKSKYYELKLDYSLGHPPTIKADVQEDLDNPLVKPADFFDKYGTHYLGSVAIGCKVTVSCAIETSKIASDFDFGAYLEATYGGKKAGVSATAGGTSQNKVEKFREHSRTSVFGVGISDEQLEKIRGVRMPRRVWQPASLC